jgi:hypothetical protein
VRTAQSTFDRVVRSLFRNSPGGPGAYNAPFLESLQIVFTHVAEMYVRLITGELDEGEIVDQHAIRSAIDTASAYASSANPSELERGLTTFLSERNPDYEIVGLSKDARCRIEGQEFWMAG